MMMTEIYEGNGSINFERNGGICCNFNPCYYSSTCSAPLDSYYLTAKNTLIFAEEPGPGMFKIPSLLCLSPVLALFCVTNIVAICTSLDFRAKSNPLPFYCCCGAIPVTYRGITLTVKDGKVVCDTRNKHCCSESDPINLVDVLDIRVVESRRVLKAIGNRPPSSVSVYDKLEILHRTAEGQLMIYTSNELQRYRSVQLLREPSGNRFLPNLTGPAWCGDVPPSNYTKFVSAAQNLVFKVTKNDENRVTFWNVDGNAHLNPQPNEMPAYYGRYSTFVDEQEGNRVVSAQFASPPPASTNVIQGQVINQQQPDMQVVQAVVIGEYSNNDQNYTSFEVQQNNGGGGGGGGGGGYDYTRVHPV
jgi:hypothetical protein